MIPRPPPSSGTELERFLLQVSSTLNSLPPVSTFSLVTPNSTVTATRGTIGLNQRSSASVLWVKAQGSGATGWVALS